MTSGKEFARFFNEFVSGGDEGETKEGEKVKDEVEEDEPHKKGVAGKALMQTEERNTGAISWEVYKQYMKAGSGEIIVPLLILSMCLMQGATVVSSYW